MIEAWVQEGVEVVFAVSPVFSEVCLRQAVRHPELRILVCSLMGNFRNVRSYYLRFFETKFLLGAAAGALAKDEPIGYIADYPILGTPASINAFALGAQLTNPDAHILLDWSTLPDRMPEEMLTRAGASVISGKDIRAAHPRTPGYGLYRVCGGEKQNLAAPVWNWGHLYADLIQGILNGGWDQDEKQNQGRALSYYPGFMERTIDIVLAPQVPGGVRKLIRILRQGLSEGKVLVFDGPVTAQDRNVRVQQGMAMTFPEIISMDFLVGNITGRIPETGELTEAAQRLCTSCGLHVSREVLL